MKEFSERKTAILGDGNVFSPLYRIICCFEWGSKSKEPPFLIQISSISRGILVRSPHLNSNNIEYSGGDGNKTPHLEYENRVWSGEAHERTPHLEYENRVWCGEVHDKIPHPEYLNKISGGETGQNVPISSYYTILP